MQPFIAVPIMCVYMLFLDGWAWSCGKPRKTSSPVYGPRQFEGLPKGGPTRQTRASQRTVLRVYRNWATELSAVWSGQFHRSVVAMSVAKKSRKSEGQCETVPAMSMYGSPVGYVHSLGRPWQTPLVLSFGCDSFKYLSQQRLDGQEDDFCFPSARQLFLKSLTTRGT